jgi:hypothetical protein
MRSAGRKGDLRVPDHFGRGHPMSAIVIYVALVLIGDTFAVGISYFVERFSDTAGLLVFFALFIFVFWAAWKLAVFLTERYVLKQS